MGFTDPNYWKQSPPPQTGDMNNERYLNQKAVLELPGAQAPQELTIADGRVSPTRAAIIVDTEGGGAADDLDIINTVVGSSTETLHNGMLITLRAKDPARAITIKNSVSPNGINTADGNDIVLSPDWELTLRLVGGRWYEVRGRSSAQADAAQNAADDAILAAAQAQDTADAAKAITDKVTPTPTANGVPQADGDGKLDGWVSLAGKANNDLSNLEPAAEDVIRAATKVTLLGTRTTTGAWTLTDCEIGRMIHIIADRNGVANSERAAISISDTAAARGLFGSAANPWSIGQDTTNFSTGDSCAFEPKASSVTINVGYISGITLYAVQ